MKSGSMLQETVIACAVLAAATGLVFGVTGQAGIGIGLAAGLVLGSGNALLITAVLDRRAPFVAGSMFRLTLLTSFALGGALILGGPIWPVALGVGLAQMVMVAVGIRQGLRAA